MTDWISHITDKKQAADDAQVALENTIRDAHAAGLSESAIAREVFGTSNRKRVRAILGRDSEGDAPRPPQYTPVVLIEGARKVLKDRIGPELWARGWASVGWDEAWHLSRGGVPVTHCQVRYSHQSIEVGLVKAKNGEYNRQLVYDGQTQVLFPVSYDPDALNKAGQPGSRGLDAAKIARAITQTLLG